MVYSQMINLQFLNLNLVIQTVMESTQNNACQQQISEQTVQQFNKICEDAHKLMVSYKQQSEELKRQITGMVGIYNENTGPTNAVPVQQIISITDNYEQGMKEANKQYVELSNQLTQQQLQQSEMIQQVMKCMKKLQNLEIKVREKKARQAKKKQQQAKKQDVQQIQQIKANKQTLQSKQETKQI